MFVSAETKTEDGAGKETMLGEDALDDPEYNVEIVQGDELGEGNSEKKKREGFVESHGTISFAHGDPIRGTSLSTIFDFTLSSCDDLTDIAASQAGQELPGASEEVPGPSTDSNTTMMILGASLSSAEEVLRFNNTAFECQFSVAGAVNVLDTRGRGNCKVNKVREDTDEQGVAGQLICLKSQSELGGLQGADGGTKLLEFIRHRSSILAGASGHRYVIAGITNNRGTSQG